MMTFPRFCTLKVPHSVVVLVLCALPVRATVAQNVVPGQRGSAAAGIQADAASTEDSGAADAAVPDDAGAAVDAVSDDGGAAPDAGPIAMDAGDPPDAGCVGATKIEVTPQGAGSSSANVFNPLPSADPTRFGLTGADVRSVGFDRTPGGTALVAGQRLTNEYAGLGVEMNNVRIDNVVYEGPASPPNATEDNTPQIFTFTVPVAAAGIVNTSPDGDRVQLFSGPNGTGALLLDFHDTLPAPINFHVDRFLGGRACPGLTIGSMILSNETGDLELDELIFEIAPFVGDAGIEIDGGASEAGVDAGLDEDAGVSDDAGEPSDATADGAVEVDAGEGTDAGAAQDASVALDAGKAADGGGGSDGDAGQAEDAEADGTDSGALADGGAADADTNADDAGQGTGADSGGGQDSGSALADAGGGALDAGRATSPDAGDAAVIPDAGSAKDDDEGCGCTAVPKRSRVAWLPLSLMFVLVFARRRRS